jgi:hypothetical protein
MKLAKYPEGDVAVGGKMRILTEAVVVLLWYRIVDGATQGGMIDVGRFQPWMGPGGAYLRAEFAILWDIDKIANAHLPWFVALGIVPLPIRGASGSE